MRETKFRGKHRDKGSWVYGSYVHCEIDGDTIKPFDSLIEIDVDPETVGQCTDLADQNGLWIYEGDVLRILVEGDEIESNVFWSDGGFCITVDHGSPEYEPYIGEFHVAKHCEVIGNIHENPE